MGLRIVQTRKEKASGAAEADEHPGTKDNADYRKKLYATLVQLGPTCQSQANYDELSRLRSKEAKLKYNKDVIDAAGAALRAMDDK